MSLSDWYARSFIRTVLCSWLIMIFSVAQVPSTASVPAPTPQHFDHVLIVVLENQSYDFAIKNDLLKSLAQKGAVFSNFANLYHYSYPNYLAMIAGSDFGTHQPQRRGEIVGLKWEDYDGKLIRVRRNIAFGEKGEMGVELPKTKASEAAVPVIAPLRRVLDAWKAKAKVTDGCWIFQAGFTRKKDHPESLLDAARMTPLSPANVLRDVVLPALEKAGIEWLGYHAFRRGLATNLRALGVDDLTISEILRHSDVKVTRASYIKIVPQKSIDAMERLEVELAKAGEGEICSHLGRDGVR